MSEIFRRYNTYQQQGRVPFEVSRKALWDETDKKQDTVRRSIRPSKRYSDNDDSYTDNSLNRKLKRLALQNKFEGKTVNTHQNIKEYNNRPWGSSRRSDSVDEAIDQLTEALQTIAYGKNDESDVDQMAIVGKALQRVAVQNNIKGNTVNTNQDIKEYNEELVEAIDRAIPIYGKSGRHQKLQLKRDLKKIADELRRIAIKNDIKGDVLNTKQNIEEFNDEVLKTLVRAIKRMAVQNEIKGSKVNTYQNIREFNDELRRFAPRLAIGNQINGNVVSTALSIAEVNNDDTSISDDSKEKAEDNLNKKTEQDSLSSKQKVEPAEKETRKAKAQDDEAGPTRRMAMHPYSRSAMDYSAMQRIKNYLMGSMQRSPQYLSSENNNMWARGYPERRGFNGDFSDEEDADNSDEKEDQDTDSSNDELAEGEINSQTRPDSIRRIQSANNYAKMRRSKLQASNSSKDDTTKSDDEEGKSQSDDLAESSDNKQSKRKTRRLMTINKSANTKKSGEIAVDRETGDKQAVEISSTSTPLNKTLKDIECKMKDGKKVSDDDLRKFLGFLEKIKSAGKTEDTTKTTK